MISLLSGSSEETAICWWLASQGFIWPEITKMSDEEFDSYDYDGTGDCGKMVLNFLIKVKNADIKGWKNLSEDEKNGFRSTALNPNGNVSGYAYRDDYEPVPKLIKCKGRKDHYRTVWRKKR